MPHPLIPGFSTPALRAPLEGLYAARRGEFRVIYRIDETQVLVLVVTIEHRRDVYRP